MQISACNCSNYYKTVDASQCPSPGCSDFINFLKLYYRDYVSMGNLLPDDKLHWGFLEEDDFVLGPNFTGTTAHF